MEKIEEKAEKQYPVNMQTEPHNHTVNAPEFDTNLEERQAFIIGYTTRNDEVVKMIEKRREFLKSGAGGYDASKLLCRNDFAISELTTLLQTIKDNGKDR